MIRLEEVLVGVGDRGVKPLLHSEARREVGPYKEEAESVLMG